MWRSRLRPSAPTQPMEVTMKRKTILSGCTTLTLALLLTACNTGGPNPTPSAAAQLSAAPNPAASTAPDAVASAAPNQGLEAPQWTSQVFAQTYYAEDNTMVMDVRYTLPMVQNTAACPAGTAINEWYQEYGDQCLAAAAETAVTAEGDYDASKSTGLPFTPTSEEMSYEVLLDSAQVISISRTWYIGSGAAYPTVFQLGDNFDTQTGIKLEAADFFTDAATVQQRVVDALMSAPEIVEGAFTREMVEQVYQAEQFCLTPEGYLFWIQGNDLPALHSPVSVTVPYAALKDVSMYAAQ